MGLITSCPWRSHTHAALVQVRSFTHSYVGLGGVGLAMSSAVGVHMDIALVYVCLQFHRCVKAAHLDIFGGAALGEVSPPTTALNHGRKKHAAPNYLRQIEKH